MYTILRVFVLWAVFGVGVLPSYAQSAPNTSTILMPSPIGWSYDGDSDGQQSWAELSPANKLCQFGVQQSPIDITRTFTASPDASLRFFYDRSKVKLHHARHSPVISIDTNNRIVDNGQSYRLVHIEIHSPSEHTINGASFPVELQLVHQDFQLNILIVSVLVNIGDINYALAPILGLLPSSEGSPVMSEFNPSLILPVENGYYSYTGSITVPPCLEGVQWRVMKSPITISEIQLETITKLTGRNSRETQPLYARQVMESP